MKNYFTLERKLIFVEYQYTVIHYHFASAVIQNTLTNILPFQYKSSVVFYEVVFLYTVYVRHICYIKLDLYI